MQNAPETESHCPANKAADIVGDSWVLQIVRAMTLGASRYSDLQQAVPRISPSILSGRLKRLAEQGIIAKRESTGSRPATYRLTASGRALEPIIKHLAIWGLHWAKRNIKEHNIDIGALMWDIHVTLRTEELPDGETVFSITLNDVERFQKWWIIAEHRSVDLCSENPGKDVDVYLNCSVKDLIAIWSCELNIRDAMDQGCLRLDAPADLVQTVDHWFPVSPVAMQLMQEAMA